KSRFYYRFIFCSDECNRCIRFWCECPIINNWWNGLEGVSSFLGDTSCDCTHFLMDPDEKRVSERGTTRFKNSRCFTNERNTNLEITTRLVSNFFHGASIAYFVYRSHMVT